MYHVYVISDFEYLDVCFLRSSWMWNFGVTIWQFFSSLDGYFSAAFWSPGRNISYFFKSLWMPLLFFLS
ncbi:unnamed protein product [Rhizophagus irregularis]|nr:unnamed protein product [Rhizophagus irregularis]